MALLSDADQKRVTAQFARPARSTAVANANNDLESVVETLDVRLSGAAVGLDHRIRFFVLTKPPSNTIIPNPKIGDRAYVFIVDDAAGAVNPTGFAEYVYNTTVTSAGAVSGTPSWKMVTMA